MAILGHHFFSNATTPVFDLTRFGASSMMKTDSVDAPADSPKGVDGQEYGAVPWLRLKAIPGSQGDTKTVYRLNTAGGKAPPTCAGMNGTITVPYAATYWLYG
jgi:hypothetical protein